MPLSRIQLRNEYGLGVRELYSESSKRDDPKAVLDGVAVAGLVGLLRQLGDLTEFAADIFHGLQEQTAATASRSRKLMTRVKHIEAALPPLEKAMLSQTSHLHFAYTPGSEWHARIRNEQNHFIYTDLPQCIMDIYEECREPPRLQLLDKFDAGGPGSCLERYSDPTFFRRVSGNSDILNDDKSKKERNACKVKKRRSWKRSSQLLYDASNFDSCGRLQFSSPPRQQQSSPTLTVSTFDITFKSDLVHQSHSIGSRDGMVFDECDFHPSASVQTNETKTRPLLSGLGDKLLNHREPKYPEEQTVVAKDGNLRSSILEKNGHSSSGVTWDEKVKMVEPMVLNSGRKEIPSFHETIFELGSQKIEPKVWKSGNDEVQEVHDGTFQLDEPDIEPKSWNCRSYDVPEVWETNFEVDDVDIDPIHQIPRRNEMAEVHEKNCELDDREIVPLGETSRVQKETEVHKTYLLRHCEQEMEPEIDRSVSVVPPSLDGMDSPSMTLDKNQPDEIESETDNFVDALNTIESESENELDSQTKGKIELCSLPNDDLQDVDSERMAGREPCENLENSVSSVHSVEDTALQRLQSSSIQDVTSGNDFIVHDDNADSSQQGSAVGEFSSSEFEPASMTAGTDKGFIYSLYTSEQPSVKSSNVGLTALWTNGGLLGLQPSKPPDFSTPNGANINNSTTVGPLNQNLKPKDDRLQGNLDSSGNDSGCDYGKNNFEQRILFSDNHEIDSSKLPPQYSNSGLERKLNNSVDSELNSRSADSQSQLLPTGGHSEAKLHLADNVRDTLNEAIHVNEEKSSFLSGLGHGLLVNGFERTRSMEYDEKPKEAGYRKRHDAENGPHVTLQRSLSGSNLREEISSPLKFTLPSPPIEHMQMSFHPINSFGTSKLKLKYPEGIDYHSETLDAYPSFQLVPEPILQHGIASDSDDNTFCRSNPCMSDDDLSHLSDSNSEPWESGDSSESRDHIPHNGMSRISFGESLSSSTDHEQMRNTSIHNGFGSSQVQNRKGVSHASSSPLPEIPVLQAMNPFGFQETKIRYNPNASMEPFDLQELTPEPPPLPPLQWRVPKLQSDASEGKEIDLISSFSDSKNRVSAYSHQAKPSADERINSGSELMNVTMTNKKLKVNVQEKISQSSKGRRVDEREDFLHQIRTKSFNLRKTGLMKPTPTPAAPTAHFNLTAILQKANAVRQAVASDDGEDDDPWSDN